MASFAQTFHRRRNILGDQGRCRNSIASSQRYKLVLGDQPFLARTENRWDGRGDRRRSVRFDRHRHDRLVRLPGLAARFRGEAIAAGIPRRSNTESAAQD
jgi:hypothetical protein